MRTLILFRHGKSDWGAEYGSDHERPLAGRGVRAAKVMGQFLRLAQQLPDSVVTSSAVRARDAVELATDAGLWGAPVRVTRRLYEATPVAVIEELRAESDETRTLLIAGHEPTWSALLADLIGGGDARVPTAAMARIDLDVLSWSETAPGVGQLVWLVPPKLFTRGGFDFAGK